MRIRIKYDGDISIKTDSTGGLKTLVLEGEGFEIYKDNGRRERLLTSEEWRTLLDNWEE